VDVGDALVWDFKFLCVLLGFARSETIYRETIYDRKMAYKPAYMPEGLSKSIK
jgi:hypothetical protein